MQPTTRPRIPRPSSTAPTRCPLHREASGDKGYHAPSTPLCVATPSTAEQVAACVRACISRGLPIVPRGAGTGVEGGCIPYSGGVVVATDRLRDISLNKDDMVCSVGAGVRKMELNKCDNCPSPPCPSPPPPPPQPPYSLHPTAVPYPSYSPRTCRPPTRTAPPPAAPHHQET